MPSSIISHVSSIAVDTIINTNCQITALPESSTSTQTSTKEREEEEWVHQDEYEGEVQVQVQGQAKEKDMEMFQYNVEPKMWEYRIEGGQKMIFSPRRIDGIDFANKNPYYPMSPILCLYSNKGPIPNEETLTPPTLVLNSMPSKYFMPSMILKTSIKTIKKLINSALTHPLRPSPPIRPSLFEAHSLITLNPDAASYFGRHTYLIEIKTKSAILSASKLIPPETARILKKYTVSSYHLKNYILQEQGKVHPDDDETIPMYDPTHLLSGDMNNTIKEIRILTKQQEKSRALRVFHDGTRMNPIDFEDLIIHSIIPLVTDHKQILTSLRYLQSLDWLDVSGASLVMDILIHERHKCQTKTYERINAKLRWTKSSLSDINEDIKERLCYKSAAQAAQSHGQYEYERAVEKVRNMDTEELEQLIVQYLVAATAKDCSILIAICEKDMADLSRAIMGFNYFTLPYEQNASYVYTVWIIDIAEKDIDKISNKWPKLEADRLQKMR